MSKKYSLWLCPPKTSTAYAEIDNVISQFSSHLNTPRFSPHLTLFSPIRGDSDKAALEQVAAYAKMLHEQHISEIAVDICKVIAGSKFYQCIFLDGSANSGLAYANAAARQKWNATEQPTFRPHVSLVYGDYQGSELDDIKQQVCSVLPSDLKTLAFTTAEIYVVETSGPFEQWYEAGCVLFSS